MKVGDIVRHKNMDDRLRIRTLKDGICSLEFIDRPKIHYVGSDKEDYERCISNIDLLLVSVDVLDKTFVVDNDNQLPLFI